jgi:hypothetical protein
MGYLLEKFLIEGRKNLKVFDKNLNSLCSILPEQKTDMTLSNASCAENQ